MRLRLVGEGLEAEARLSGLALEGEAAFTRALGKARLTASARFQGDLPRLDLVGGGVLRGEGAGIPFRFTYRYRGGAPDLAGLVLRAEAEGVGLALEGGRLALEVDRDLTPFGLPLRLKARGKGPLEAPIALTLEGREGRLSGQAWLWPLRAELQGEAYGERLEALWAEGLSLRFAGPHLFGEARYGDGLSGRLALRYPLPGGGA